MPTQLELTLFGSPEIRLHGRSLGGFRSSKVQAWLLPEVALPCKAAAYAVTGNRLNMSASTRVVFRALVARFIRISCVDLRGVYIVCFVPVEGKPIWN